MAFDAVKVKEEQSKKNKLTRKEKKISKQIDKINQVYPIIGYTEEGYIKTKYSYKEVFLEILDCKKYDLFLMDNEEFNYTTENYWKFQKLYHHPVKEVYMNFPEDNQQQQEYFKHKIENTSNPAQLAILHTELEKLKHIEKNYEMRDIYLFIYADNVTELRKRVDLLNNFYSFLGTKQISIEKKKKILFKLNNHNTKG
ncbi:hypothetical protein [Metabacillus niabensis]|uniref:hypothetical protein n=1 Tax=Metabacillus niabensis TaxID=324854 RepID=UPI0039A0A7EA